MSLVILNAEPHRFNPLAAAQLRKLGDYVEVDCDRDRLLQEVARADVLIVRLRNRIDREILDRASRLKMIGTATTGLNHIDQNEASRREIRIISLRGETQFLSSITATAEFTWGLLLELVRNLSLAREHVRAGHWDRDRFVGRDLQGKIIGVVGYGRLGSIVASYARAFRMHVMAFDRDLIDSSEAVEKVDLQTLLMRSDVVSVHLSYEAANAQFFGPNEFSRMKQGAIFINTARGELVDENALADALESGRLSGAALDVLDAEGGPQGDWLRDRRLWTYARTHDNLVLTPHLGGACIESMHETESFLVRKILAALADAGTSDGAR